MRRHQADSAALDQSFDHGFSADAAVMGIGAAQKLIEEKYHG